MLKSVWKNRNVLIETTRGMYEGIVVPTAAALYGSEAWVLVNKVKNRMDVTEMSCLMSMCKWRQAEIEWGKKRLREDVGFKEAIEW